MTECPADLYTSTTCNHCQSCNTGFSLEVKANGNSFCEADLITPNNNPSLCSTCGSQNNGVPSCCHAGGGLDSTWMAASKTCGDKDEQRLGQVDFSYGEGRKACTWVNGRRL